MVENRKSQWQILTTTSKNICGFSFTKWSHCSQSQDAAYLQVWLKQAWLRYISWPSCLLNLPHSDPKVNKLKQPLSQVELLQHNSKMSRPKHTQNMSKNLHMRIDLHMCKMVNNNHQFLWASLSFIVVSLLILNSWNSVVTWIWDAPFLPFHETWVMLRKLTCLALLLWRKVHGRLHLSGRTEIPIK